MTVKKMLKFFAALTVFYFLSFPALVSANIVTGGTLTGIASFYAKFFEGRETTTGEKFRHNLFTGASNNLPLNTWVRVTNLRNGKSVIVRINDRMHPRMAKKGRVIDLTHVAAHQLGFNDGLIKVKMQVIPAGIIEE
ncbi:MAG: septal ring lytic transglycosylase RlpA family protein [Chitinophagaceae bacterium]|nr:septal ring lytic transglycosylase RlpA family protein [Chitinophagaceae bacterium]